MSFLQHSWLALVLLALSLILGARLLWIQHRQGRWSMPLIVVGGVNFFLAAAGLSFLPADSAFWILVAGLIFLSLLLLLVVLNGTWIAALGYFAGAVLLFGIGATYFEGIGDLLIAAGSFLLSMVPVEPWWLLLLLLLPFIVWLSFRSLSGLGPVRRWLAIGLRCLGIALLALALADTHARKPDDSLTVLFVWDRSLSIPPEQEGEGGIDLRKQRLMNFINEAVKKRGQDQEADRVGVIVFGRRAYLELPPASVPKLNFHKIMSPVDDTHTDIAAAIKLALASFPEGTAKRLVLISDGNENIGQAEEQARIARQNGVQIDVVPVASGRRSPNEVLVERLEVPPVTDKDTRLPIRIVLRSMHPQTVVGTLELSKTTLDLIKDQPVFEGVPIFTATVKLRPGLNVYYYQQPGSKKEDATTYEAKFVPLGVEDARGRFTKGLPGDRIENNRASASVMSRGQRALLLIEPKIGDHKLLADRLQKAKPSLKIVTVEPKMLPQDPAKLAVVLAKFDAVVMANVPADDVTEEQQRVFRANVHDQGAGLIMVGGPQGFGAGGWQDTELERALPVTADLKSIKVEGKSGLVQIMHASEMADGNAWQRKIAKLAIEKLSPVDMVGVSYFDHGFGGGAGGPTWHIKFQEIGNKKKQLIAKLDNMMPGDMPDADPFFIMAYKELTNPAYGLGTKHIIFISDGDHWGLNPPLLTKIRAAKITCTTVCITTHGADEVKKMAAVAQLTKGRAYHIKDPSELPAIYIKESRLVSQSFVYEKKFTPRLVARSGPTEGLKELEDLHGFVRTTPRVSPLVEVPIKTPKIGETDFPILAYWQYGLGKAVAFTSDARSQLREKENFWDKDWASSNMYIKFWEQLVDFALRSVDTGKFLQLTTEQRGGKVRVIVEANDNDADKTPITNLKLKAGVMSPTFKEADNRKVEIQFEQKGAGVYEGEFPTDEVGAYFLNIQASWTKGGKEIVDSVRGGVVIPYSPEFAEMESNAALMEKLRDITSGNTYPDDGPSLEKIAQSGVVFRPNPISQQSLQPLWFWLVLVAGLCLFCDVAIRRIALEPSAVWALAVSVWGKLRRQQAAAPVTVFLERLQTSKAKVEESLEKKKAGRRFEAGEGKPAAPLPDATSMPSKPEAAPAKSAPAKKAPEPQEDFATRLMRAKKKALEDRDKDKPK